MGALAFLPAPSLPVSHPQTRHKTPPLCSNKRRKPRPHRPPKVRQSPGPRILTQISPAKGERSDEIRQILCSRKDALIVGNGLRGKIAAAIAAREKKEDTLVLVATRYEAELAATEAGLQAGDTKVVIASGQGGLSWAHAGANANASVKAVIVVGSVRGIDHAFIRDGHGSKWLKKVRYIVLGGVWAIWRVDGGKGMWKVLNSLRVKDVRKNCVMLEDMTGIEDVIKGGIGMLVRKNHQVVDWDIARESGVGVVVCENWGGVWNVVKGMLREGGVFLCQTGRMAEVWATLARSEGLAVEDGRDEASRRRGLNKIWEGGSLLTCGTVGGVEKVVQIGFVGERWKERGEGQHVLICVKRELEWVRQWVGQDVETEFREGGEVEGEVGDVVGEKGYASLLGFYLSVKNSLGMDKEEVVRWCNEWAEEVLGRVPALDKRVVDRLRLRRVSGVRVKQVARV